MRTMVYYDDTAPRRDRWRVLRELPVDLDPRGRRDPIRRWATVKSFPTEREANAFLLGYGWGRPQEPRDV